MSAESHSRPFTYARVIDPKNPVAEMPWDAWNSTRVLYVSIPKTCVTPWILSFSAAGPLASLIRKDCSSRTSLPVLQRERFLMNMYEGEVGDACPFASASNAASSASRIASSAAGLMEDEEVEMERDDVDEGVEVGIEEAREADEEVVDVGPTYGGKYPPAGTDTTTPGIEPPFATVKDTEEDAWVP